MNATGYIRLAAALSALGLGAHACAPARTTELSLRHVVLYQNGIGYFEHTGQVQGQSLELWFRRHEIGDVLKTLTIVEAGAAQTAGAALAVTAMVPGVTGAAAAGADKDNDKTKDPAQADRIAVSVALDHQARDLWIAYAVPMPTWRASYRVVLPEPGDKRALLQGWATINNTTEQDWRSVKLTLATGAPLSFAIDLHTPVYVARPDVNGNLVEPLAVGAISAERALPGDRDGDRAQDADDLCPDAAEDRDGWEDEDGCPDPDNDKDRVSDASDQCPNEPETYNGMEDEDGCPDRGRVVVTDASIEILDRIYFARNKATIKPESFPIIDATAATLLGNPDIRALEIQGHASTDEMNTWTLATARAQAVQRALVERGVGTRLVVTPYGPSMPIRTGDDEQSRAHNRRVEFLILERDDGDSEPASGAPAPGASRRPAANRPAASPLSAATLANSVRAQVTPRDVAGSVRYEIAEPVTVARGASALVPILNQPVAGEDVYLFRPDANAPASQNSPWRAARLSNETRLPLEPGPVAIFAAGTFVGEGLIERIHPDETAFIPYALDSSTVVSMDSEQASEPVELVAIVRGVATLEDRAVHLTRYQVRAGARPPGRIFVRHERTSGYKARDLPPSTVETASAYLVPMPIVAGKTSVLEVREERPARREIRIIDNAGPDLAVYLKASRVSPELGDKLTRIVELRAELGRIEEGMESLRQELLDVSMRADEIRESLNTLGKTGSAADLRKKLLRSLAETTEQSERIGKKLAEATLSQSEARARLVEAIAQLQYQRAPKLTDGMPE